MHSKTRVVCPYLAYCHQTDSRSMHSKTRVVCAPLPFFLGSSFFSSPANACVGDSIAAVPERTNIVAKVTMIDVFFVFEDIFVRISKLYFYI